MSRFSEQSKQWKQQVAAIAESGYYADVGRAVAYAEEHVFPVWRTVNQADSIREVVGKRGLTGAQVLIVHLFARGVLGLGPAAEDAPRLVVWRPSRAVGATGEPVCPRVIGTADIARLIGRSRYAVERALRRFKGLEGARPKCRTWSVISMPTGVALDGALSTATLQPFMYAVHEYADARHYAGACKQRSARFTGRQDGWCRGALFAAGKPVQPARKHRKQAAAVGF
jgi:hypothetical protein